MSTRCKHKKLKKIDTTFDSKKNRYYDHQCVGCNAVINRDKAEAILHGSRIVGTGLRTKARGKLVETGE